MSYNYNNFLLKLLCLIYVNINNINKKDTLNNYNYFHKKLICLIYVSIII